MAQFFFRFSMWDFSLYKNKTRSVIVYNFTMKAAE